MKGKKTSVERIIKILREMEVLQGQGLSIDAGCKQLGVSSQSFYKWRKEYMGRWISAKQENSRNWRKRMPV